MSNVSPLAVLFQKIFVGISPPCAPGARMPRCNTMLNLAGGTPSEFLRVPWWETRAAFPRLTNSLSLAMPPAVADQTNDADAEQGERSRFGHRFHLYEIQVDKLVLPRVIRKPLAVELEPRGQT